MDIGLGKMGMNMVTRLCQGGHRVVAYDRSTALITEAEGKGATASSSLGRFDRPITQTSGRVGHGPLRQPHRRNRTTSRKDPGRQRYRHRWRQYKIS
jgi:nucleoside-diphosphate-sugar epimerase